MPPKPDGEIERGERERAGLQRQRIESKCMLWAYGCVSVFGQILIESENGCFEIVCVRVCAKI